MIVTDIKSGKGVVIFCVKGVSVFAVRRIGLCSQSLGGRITVVERTSDEMREFKDFNGVISKELGRFAYLTGDKGIDKDILVSMSLLKDRLDSTGLKGFGSYVIPESFLCSAEIAIPIKLVNRLLSPSNKKDKVLGSAEIANVFYVLSEEWSKRSAFTKGRQGGRRWR